MSRLQWVALGVCLVAGTAFGPGEAAAYGGVAHERAADHAVSIFGFPEMEDFRACVVDGSSCEDHIDHTYWDYDWLYMAHFWDADLGDFDDTDWGADSWENAWVRSRTILGMALQKMDAGQVDSSYHYLGHVAHLITDMCCPCHAHKDYHWPDDDCFEDWMDGCDGDCGMGCEQWDWQDAVNAWGGLLDIPEDRIDQIINVILPGEMWYPERFQASLYYLMYTSNQTAGYFASDNYDGNTTERHGWMNYGGWPGRPTDQDQLDNNDLPEPDNDGDGDLTILGDWCYTYSMCACATLYELWRDFWDHIAPTTEIGIAGPGPVHDGWRPGDVLVTLAASDDSQGWARRDSGVDHIRYKIADGDTQRVYSPAVFINFNLEGVWNLIYTAMDRFANLDAFRLEVVKIDKTPPEVSIISPVPDGLYLTDGSFTIDYECTDVPSGVWGIVADLDGVPVSDGQVFDDLHNMAGFHTVTVTAEDFAGNTTTRSVTFSIKIHATVDLTPNPLTTKSNGVTMLAEIEFPPEYDVTFIDVGTTIVTVDGHTVPAKLWPTTLGHFGPDGLLGRLVEFNRRLITAALVGVTGDVTMIVSGWLTQPIEFYGTDVVEVFTSPRLSLPATPTADVPDQVVVECANPAPLRGSAAIGFGLPQDGMCELDVFDVAGRRVVTLVRDTYPAGYHTVYWDTDGAIGTGVYFLRLRHGSDVATTKTVISK